MSFIGEVEKKPGLNERLLVYLRVNFVDANGIQSTIAKGDQRFVLCKVVELCPHERGKGSDILQIFWFLFQSQLFILFKLGL